MSRSNRRKDENHAIQRASANLPVGAVNTPRGPAVIKIIDVQSDSLGPMGQATSGAAVAKPGGINILGAVLRRWWLVLLVAVFVGGAGVLLADRLVKPSYEVEALVLYHYITPVRGNGVTVATDPAEVIRTHIELLTKPEISLIAARNPELQQALPWLRGLDLANPAVQKEVARRLRGICLAIPVKNTELVQIITEKPDGFVASAVVNAFADAFVEHCSNQLMGRDAVRRRKLQEQVDQQEAMLKELIKKRNELMVAFDADTQALTKTNLITQISEYNKLKSEAEIKRLASEAELSRYLQNTNQQENLSADLQLKRKQRIEEEKQKDSLLQAAIVTQINSYQKYMEELALGKTEHHQHVIQAREQMKLAQKKVEEREAEIAAAINAKVAEEQKLFVTKDVEEARAKLRESEAQVKSYEGKLGQFQEEHKKLAVEFQKIEQVKEAIGRVQKHYDDMWGQLQGLKGDQETQGDAVIMVAERADIPQKPTDDKRVKVQAASVIGGLFLGIFLALLVDKFDKRLRQPRDIESLLGAPMLGMIPRIQELKRAKGDAATNLIAEEFRLIRTQLLFGNPGVEHRTICVTSPVPGDGKTSLSVNLAISLAKAGRRVLLVDADLRKPDIHQIFSVPEGPGFSDLLDNSADLATAVRKTDVENLEIMAAGSPTNRPCELLSRPQMRSLLEALGEIYDHVVFDSAPLLPVSDTHVLSGLVDGVICSFNAEVSSDTVKSMDEILRRLRANVIGSVMNQVKYKQTTTYSRGKSAYSSYYSSPRTAAAPPQPAAAALPESVSTGLNRSNG